MADDLALARAFLDWQANTKRRSGWTTYKSARLFEHLIDHLDAQGLTLSTATETDLRSFIDRRRPRVATPSNATMASEIWRISKLYSWLHERGLIPTQTAAKLLLSGAPAVHNEDPKPVPLEIWRRVWGGELTDTERVALGLGYFCGLRRSEIMGLRPEQFVGNVIVGITRKGGERVGFPLASTLRFWQERLPAHVGACDLHPLLMRLVSGRAENEWLLGWHDEVASQPPHKGRGDGPRPYAAPSSPNVFNARLNTALERNGLRRSTITPHMLRHSFCTYLLQGGVPLEIVSQLAGHKKIQTTLRYVKALDDPLAKLLNESGPYPRPRGHHRLEFGAV